MVTKAGTSGDDVLKGTAAKDKLWGYGGDDKLFGGDGPDKLYGGTGDDKLYGGAGGDTLDGGKGNDKLSGGDGHDTFVFGKNSGKDVVTDFDVKKDMLQISKTHDIQTVKDVLDHAHQTKSGDVVINLGDGNKITLKNVDLADLKKHPHDHFDVS